MNKWTFAATTSAASRCIIAISRGEKKIIQTIISIFHQKRMDMLRTNTSTKPHAQRMALLKWSWYFEHIRAQEANSQTRAHAVMIVVGQFTRGRSSACMVYMHRHWQTRTCTNTPRTHKHKRNTYTYTYKRLNKTFWKRYCSDCGGAAQAAHVVEAALVWFACARPWANQESPIRSPHRHEQTSLAA